MELIYNNLTRKIQNKILAVGKNYLEHSIEMGQAEPPKVPVIFEKAFTNVLPPSLEEKTTLLKIHSSSSIHHEIELGLIIKKKLKFYKTDENWRDYIGGYFLWLDLTDRDMQSGFKKKGLPWTMSKWQDSFMPVSGFIHDSDVKDPHNLDIEFKINGVTKQKGNTKEFIFKIPTLLEYITTYMTLNEGDMLITGTPAGVGPIKDEDTLFGCLSENGEVLQTLDLKCSIIPMTTKFTSKL